jgi:TolA-binding protein
MNKTFAPKALILFKIASWLNESQKHKEAIFALNTLIKSYPEDTLVPKAYCRAAQIFNEQLKNTDQARKILNGLLHKFPDHEISAFAKNYLGGI